MTLGLILPADIPIPYLEDLQYCSFPYLEELSLSACLTPSVLTFMRRNNLYIRDLYITSDLDSRKHAPPCTFLELKVYRGDPEFILAFLPGSPVQQINITCRVFTSPLGTRGSFFMKLSNQNVRIPIYFVYRGILVC